MQEEITDLNYKSSQISIFINPLLHEFFSRRFLKYNLTIVIEIFSMIRSYFLFSKLLANVAPGPSYVGEG